VGIIEDKFGKFQSEAPLVYTLFVLGFPQESALDGKISLIQEKLKSVYPIFDTQVSQSFSINHRDNKAPKVTAEDIKEYVFFNDNRTSGIILKRDKLTFHTSEYESFPQFAAAIRLIIGVISQILSIGHYNFIGIRHVDAIVPSSNNETLEDILNPRLMPFKLLNGTASKTSFSNQLHGSETEDGVLILKTYHLFTNDFCIPPELQPASNMLNIKNVRRSGPFAVLDFDHNYMVPNGAVEKLDIESLLVKLDSMHEALSLAFINTLKEGVLERWTR
jgi:uncharacterized protein (TIGR04255 family)